MNDYSKIELQYDPNAEAGGKLFRDAICCADAGSFDDAIRLAEAIEDYPFRLSSYFRDNALCYIAEKLAEAGKFSLLTNVIARIRFDVYASEVTLAIAQGLAKEGKKVIALALAHTIRVPSVRLQAIADLEGSQDIETYY
jgi:hypothetical protein